MLRLADALTLDNGGRPVAAYVRPVRPVFGARLAGPFARPVHAGSHHPGSLRWPSDGVLVPVDAVFG